MTLDELITGGSYELAGGIPVFVFRATDLAAVRAYVEHMFVALDVRHDAKGQLAYHCAVPDRGEEAVAIPIPAKKRAAVAAAAKLMNTCATRIVDGAGGSLDLNRFATDLDHDWSGVYATARALWMEDKQGEAVAVLSPLTAAHADRLPAAHHLEGRCYRELGELERAVACYQRAVAAAVATDGEQLLPHAAGYLSDLGVAYKKLELPALAATVFQHSLHLRPNHPAALATLVTVFPQDADLTALVLPRMARLAAAGLGDAQSLLPRLASALADAQGTTAEALVDAAERDARAVDLARWPIQRPGFGTMSAMKRDLAAAS